MQTQTTRKKTVPTEVFSPNLGCTEHGALRQQERNLTDWQIEFACAGGLVCIGAGQLSVMFAAKTSRPDWKSGIPGNWKALGRSLPTVASSRPTANVAASTTSNRRRVNEAKRHQANWHKQKTQETQDESAGDTR